MVVFVSVLLWCFPRGTSFDRSIGKRLEVNFLKNLKLEEGIDWKFLWEYLSKGIDSKISNCVVKKSGELILQAWHGQRTVNVNRLKEGTYVVVRTQEQMGTLLLTTRRTIW
jgi:hypothetical protein